MSLIKCPFCAEEIQEDAKICKHCQKDLTKQKKIKNQQANRQTFKLLGIILLIILTIYLWYIVIPIILAWYIWEKTNLDKKKKLVGFALSFILLFILMGIKSYLNPIPKITIYEPTDNFFIQATSTLLKGTIKPTDSETFINGNKISINENGQFEYLAELKNENNIFTISTTKKEKNSQIQITINRIYTDEEKIELEKIRLEQEKIAEEEHKKQAALLKAEKEAWEKSKAGQICKTNTIWTKEECQKLADNTIWVGMSYDMLVYKRGKPNHANPSNYGYRIEWQWCWNDYNPSCFYDNNNDGIIDSYN